jgi:hypothetical protein
MTVFDDFRAVVSGAASVAAANVTALGAGDDRR